MNLQEILVADCTSILLMIILLVTRYVTRRKRRTEDKFFLALVLIGMSAAILELVAFLVDGRNGGVFKALNIISNFFIYSCTTTISIVWLWYVDSNLNHNVKRIKTIFLPFVIIWATLMIMLVVNLFTGFVYTIDANNIYGRKGIGYIYYGFLFTCFIASLIDYLIHRIKHGSTQFFPIWAFLIPVISACIVQALWYGIATAWLGCAIGLTAIYLNIQSRFALIDGLTGLNNRAFVEHKLIVARSKMNRFVYGGLMLDIDSFKQINDTYGHSVGDEALKNVAKILVNSCGRDTLIFRFAGDEFVILVRTPLSQKEHLIEKMDEIKNAIRRAAEEFNKGNEQRYKFNFSFGHALFESSLSDDEFFHNMDLEMYKEKKEHHKILDNH